MSMQLQHLMPFVFGVAQLATIVFLVWLYRCTRLTAVLCNIAYHVVSTFAGWGWRVFNDRVSHAPPETASAVSSLLAMTEVAVGTALFLWMLISLVRWGRPILPAMRSSVVPGPAV